MTALQLATVALGLAALALGALVPATGPYAFPAGVGLITLTIPAFQKKAP